MSFKHKISVEGITLRPINVANSFLSLTHSLVICWFISVLASESTCKMYAFTKNLNT